MAAAVPGRGAAPGGRLPAVVVLLAVLLVIVAAGVGAGGHSVRSHKASPRAARALVDAGLGAATVVVVLVAGFLAGALWIRRKREPPPEQRVYQAPPVPWALRVALLLVILLLAAGIAAVLRGAPTGDRPSRPAPPAAGELPLDRPEPAGKRSIGADAPAVAAVVVLGLATTAVLATRDRRRRWAAPRVPAPAGDASPPEPAGDIGVDDLLTGPDPRRAVVAAYARMERVLTAAGVARHPSDAPFEYVGRIRRALAPPGPPAGGPAPGDAPPASGPEPGHGPAVVDGATRLTGLFERAKFGAATVDPAMQAAAVAALRAVIDHLAVSP